MQKSIFQQKIQKSLCITTKSMNKFKRNYLENYNDSEHTVKTKNAPFFMIFPNISFLHIVVNYWTGPLKLTLGGGRRGGGRGGRGGRGGGGGPGREGRGPRRAQAPT